MTPGSSEAQADTRGEWPVWSAETAPGDLARYVVPDVVRRHAEIPGPSGGLIRDRLQTVWDRLRAAGIGYAHEPDRSTTESGTTEGGATVVGQWIRPPGEVLVAPKNGTCLDLAVLLAGACLHAGLQVAVLVLDAAEPGRAGHALLAVLVGDAWPGGNLDGGVWASAPQGLLASVQVGLAGPPRDVLVLDPNGIAHPVGAAVAGTDVNLETAALAGHGHLTSGAYVWRLAVVAGARDDVHVPAPVPRVRPLRGIYRHPQTAESALRLLRAEYQVTPFQSRDELTVLLDFCQQTSAGDRTGIAVVHGAGGSGKTRLALELAETLRADGWYAGPLREKLADADPAALAWLTEVTAPLLVIVDYADARVVEAQALLAVLAGRSGRPSVVLLTGCTTDGDWLDLVLLGWLAAQGRTELPAERGPLYDEVLEHESRYSTQQSTCS